MPIKLKFVRKLVSESQQEKLMSEIKVYTLNKLDEKKFTTLLTFVVIIEGKE